MPLPLPHPDAEIIRHLRDYAMFVIDRSGHICSWNEGVREILGWEESEWLGQPAVDIFTADDALNHVLEKEIETATATGRADDDRWMLRKTGERFFASGTLTRIDGAAGSPPAFLKIVRDLTDARRAQEERERLAESEATARSDADRQAEALAEREEQLRAVFAGVRDYAIFTVDPAGLISSWHEGAQSMKGYNADEAIGMPFANLFTPEEREKGQPQREMAIAARSGEYKGEGKRLRKNGEIFEAAVVLTALHRPDGELLGFLKLTQDVSEQKRQLHEREAALRAAEAARLGAERLNHSKDEFLATISHELRTPLGAILGWAHVLERGIADPGNLKHGLAAITRNARVQVQLIEDLLDMNRIESGQMRLDLQRVDLAVVISNAIEAVMPSAAAKNISLRTVLDPAVGQINGDPERLQQIVWNLLNNAVKFTPAEGRVEIALARRRGQVEIAVRDSGQGISAEFIDQVFERFRQQDASTTRRAGGLGLGLAIVRQLTELHGGSVRAESGGKGSGSVFTVAFPALTAARAEPPFVDRRAPPPAAAGAPLPAGAAAAAADASSFTFSAEQRLVGTTVMVVDDEPDGRAIAAHLLEAAGAGVVTAANAHEAFDLLRRRRPDVVLCDIGMPDHDGYEFLRWVRSLSVEEGGRTPAAAFTAYARAQDRDRALKAGYEMHLVKPVEPGALVAAVESLARQSAAIGSTGPAARSG